jgi:hypothetical protein
LEPRACVAAAILPMIDGVVEIRRGIRHRTPMSRARFRTEDHRLEAGGFDSRLKARLLLLREKIRDRDILAQSTSTEFRDRHRQPTSARRAGSRRRRGIRDPGEAH